MPFLFAATLFVSAALMFLVEPMIAKMILPRFGGTPAVWNTCMVFFQAALLAGYSYAHLATKWLGLRRQAGLHVFWLLLPVVSLPIGIAVSWTPQGQENPAWLLLGVLGISVGLPFFVVATSAPLLQKWFAGTGHRAARDPYFLYAASNLGSMLALLSYPILVEPSLTLKDQGRLWAIGYGVLAFLTLACIWVVWKSPAADAAPSRNPKSEIRNPKTESVSSFRISDLEFRISEDELSWPRRLRWVALAFVPSSLMLGVTSHISLDVAPIPLIWVIPLALYLLSFILVFSRLPYWVHAIFRWTLPVLVLVLLFMMLSGLHPSFQKLIPVHLVVFFVAAMACHGELARSRPSPKHLTEFYLWMSAGGVLGGLFNALIAPMVFRSIQEYSLAMVLACMMMPGLGWTANRWWTRALDFGLPVFVGGLAWYLFWAFEQERGEQFLDGLLKILTGGVAETSSKESGDGFLGSLTRGWHNMWSDTDTYDLRNILQFGIPIVICYGFIPRPIRCGLSIGALLLAHAYYPGFNENVLHQERNFFGVLKVKTLREDGVKILREGEDTDNLLFHELLNGTTLHGTQRVSSIREETCLCSALLTATTPGEVLVTQATGRQYWTDWRRQPISYYHITGPVADLFQAFSGPWKKKELAFIGLGTGTLLAYGVPGQKITVYEINPADVRIAEHTEYFSFASTCQADPWPDGRHYRLVMGDARLSLEREPDGRFGIIMVDAFSSDAIPVHLITKEAVELYFQKLAPHGVVALHISNRYLDLEPVTAVLAMELKLAFRIRSDNVSGEEGRQGKSSSTWVLLARDELDLYPLTDNPEWVEHPLQHLVAALDESRKVPEESWPEFLAKKSDEIAGLDAGRDKKKLERVRGEIIELLARSRDLPDDEFKAKRVKLEEAARKIAGGPLWTDDFSNIWMIFHWKR
jgi:hypothetical protein